MISKEEIERKLCEKLELELAAKERQIVTLVDETQKLQSTLIKIKENSLTQVRRKEKQGSFYFPFNESCLSFIDIWSWKWLKWKRQVNCTTRK